MTDINKKDEWIYTAFPLTFLSFIFILPSLLNFYNNLISLPQNTFLKLVFSTLPIQLCLILPSLASAFFISRGFPIKTKLNLTKWRNEFLLKALGIEILILIPIGFLAYISFTVANYFNLNTQNPLLELISTAEIKGLIFLFIVAVFIAPLTEEIVFRRVFYTFSRKVFGYFPSITLTAFLFAILHAGTVQFLPIFFLGIVLQYLYIHYKTLYPCILLHMIHNSFMMILVIIDIHN